MTKYSTAAIVILVGIAFNVITNRESAGADVLSAQVGQTDWYKDVMENGSEWDKSFLPADPSQVVDMSADANPATTTSVQNTLAWYVSPLVKFHDGDTAGLSEDGNITIETAGGNIVVTCKVEDGACTNAKEAVAVAIKDLETARGQ